MRHRIYKRHQKGSMLLDLVVASMLSLIVGAAILMFQMNTYNTGNLVQGQNLTDSWARKSLDILADSIRDAQSYQISASPVTNSALQAASSNSITCYTDSAGDYAKYWLDTTVNPPALKKTTNAGTTTVMVSGLQSLTLTYYVSGGQYNAASSSWVTTASPHAPTSAELPNVGAVAIDATVTINGYTRRMTSLVRLRNSPL